MQTITIITHFLLSGFFEENVSDSSEYLQKDRVQFLQLSASSYQCLDAALLCSGKFLKIKGSYLWVVDRKGKQLSDSIISYHIRYLNLWNQWRNVEHQGNKLTDQALRYFDSRETGITFYIDELVAAIPGSSQTYCVNGMSLTKLK